MSTTTETLDQSLRTVLDAMGQLTLKPATKNKYSCAVRLYEAFQRHEARVADVTAERLELFARWLLDDGKSERYTKHLVEYVGAIARFADPEWLPVSTVRRRKPALDGRARNKRRQPDEPDRRCRKPALDGQQAAKETGKDRLLVRVCQDLYFPSRLGIASKGTVHQYHVAIYRLSCFLGRPATLDDLNDLTIGKSARAMRDEGLAANTTNGYLKNLKALWTWCAKRRILEEFPTVENLKTPARIPKAWTQEELLRLIEATELMGGRVGGVPAWIWWRALIAVVWDTGERRGAIFALRWEWLRPATGELEVPAEARKGGQKPMLYRLKPATLQLLDAMRAPERALIFPIDFCEGTFFNHYKTLLRYAGLPYSKGKSGLHKIRRTFASHLTAAGGDATIALDHTSRKVTTQSYLDPSIARSMPANALLFDVSPQRVPAVVVAPEAAAADDPMLSAAEWL